MGIRNEALKGAGRRVVRPVESEADVDRCLRSIYEHEEAGGRAREEGRDRARRLWEWFRGEMRRRPLDDWPWEEALVRVHVCLEESCRASESLYETAWRLNQKLDAWLNDHPEILAGKRYRNFPHGRVYLVENPVPEIDFGPIAAISFYWNQCSACERYTEGDVPAERRVDGAIQVCPTCGEVACPECLASSRCCEVEHNRRAHARIDMEAKP